MSAKPFLTRLFLSKRLTEQQKGGLIYQRLIEIALAIIVIVFIALRIPFIKEVSALLFFMFVLRVMKFVSEIEDLILKVLEAILKILKEKDGHLAVFIGVMILVGGMIFVGVAVLLLHDLPHLFSN